MQAVSPALVVCAITQTTPTDQSRYGLGTFTVRLQSDPTGLQPASRGRLLQGDTLACVPGEPPVGEIAIVERRGELLAVRWWRETLGQLPGARLIGRRVGRPVYVRDVDWKEIAGGRDVPRYWQEQDR